MRSKITQKLIDETPKEINDRVDKYAEIMTKKLNEPLLCSQCEKEIKEITKDNYVAGFNVLCVRCTDEYINSEMEYALREFERQQEYEDWQRRMNELDNDW